MEVNYCPRVHHESHFVDLAKAKDHSTRIVGQNCPTEDMCDKNLKPAISDDSPPVISDCSQSHHTIKPQHQNDKSKTKVKKPQHQSLSVSHNSEKYAFSNEGFVDTNDGCRQSKLANCSPKELNNHTIFETNHSSQVDHAANKQREENHSEAHPAHASVALKQQPSQAVIFENVCYDIPRKQNLSTNLMICSKNSPLVPILKSIYLNIPQGSIYGLLGPSSCGKTTLLRCLVGLLRPASGTIRLFGHDLINDGHRGKDSENCHVPGKNIGYMPQDLGLYEDFSIKQILTMFGRYMFMPKNLILDRIEFMTKFLDLPDKDRIVGTLSGGQKRRVSFAIACFHMPPLIILDEPTVGVDPLLRKAIWTFLRRLASNENRTILITTHYIEEAARADLVALMRNGEIVMQDTPHNIMRSQSSLTLEEAFLKICSKRSSDNGNISKNIKLTTNKNKAIQPYSISSNKSSRSVGVLQIDGPEEDVESGCCLRGLHYRRNYSLNPVNGEENNRKLPLRNKDSKTSHKSQLDITSNRSYKSSSSINGSTSPQFDSSIRTNILGIDGPNEKSKTKLTTWLLSLKRNTILFQALVYKNYKRNFNSIPLVIFQFMLPIIQMITFCLCIGGKPTNIGLGIVNTDNPPTYFMTLESGEKLEPLSSIFLSYIDTSTLDLKPYPNLTEAINDVSRAKLWAVLEFGPNFTEAVTQRFNLPDILETDAETVKDSLIRLHSDKTRRILDILCLRSLMESYKQFLNKEFVGFEHLPIEMGQPIFKIKPSLIGTSVDGYTESIAAGLMVREFFQSSSVMTCS